MTSNGNALKKEAVDFVREYFAKNGNGSTKVVIGISGGKDSSTVAALCCEALGKDRVVGVLMPNGVQKDISDSHRLCDFLGIENYTVNIAGAYEGISEAVKSAMGKESTPDQFNTNTPSRLRMATLYGVTAMLGNARVSCNGNLSERLAGFFTLWGDGAGDFAPLAWLFVREVVELGLALGLPEDLVRKAPSDGMCGMTDEAKLGFTYDELEAVALGKADCVPSEKAEKIQKRIQGIEWKKRLLNLPAFVPSFRNIEKWK